ncbi:MAG: FAD-binding oxidoreductase [Caldilineaceae bacterium]|nr:FAD-binding oxidoreductase [Caldilineaceae bacterium]
MRRSMAYPTPRELFDRRQLTTDPVELITYEVDAGFDRATPDGVFYPESAQDVSRLVVWARQAGVPLIARGAGDRSRWWCGGRSGRHHRPDLASGSIARSG